ncbi:hypothetical protein [Sphingomonas sp. KR3-1]|uniref:hypothetical protein n=1 Tax=Sphingomonas sp. KR3-1 TaxID=3156611 RepID=UPI0032B362A3
MEALTNYFRQNGDKTVKVTFHDDGTISGMLTAFDERGIALEGQPPVTGLRLIPWTAIAILDLGK